MIDAIEYFSYIAPFQSFCNVNDKLVSFLKFRLIFVLLDFKGGGTNISKRVNQKQEG